MSEFLSPDQAHSQYNLAYDISSPRSHTERALLRNGIARIAMPLKSIDFSQLSETMADLKDEYPDLIHETPYTVDGRYGNEAGYVRKEKKINPDTGLQKSDGKSYFHFTETARDRWREQFSLAPRKFKRFLEDGFEMHDVLCSLARVVVVGLENSHPNIGKLYFPNQDRFSFLRLLRYDGYEYQASMGEVAKPHYDISGVTIQAYADAPGFWGAKDGVHGRRTFYDTAEHEAYMFMGKGHQKVYGTDDQFKPLWHGVDRIVPADATYIPERTAAILFLDAPQIDYQVRTTDTLPQLIGQNALSFV